MPKANFSYCKSKIDIFELAQWTYRDAQNSVYTSTRLYLSLAGTC